MPHRPEAPIRDLVIRGGHVFDPATGDWREGGVAVDAGHVVAVGPSADAVRATMVVDVGDAMVVPGLTDLHLHAYPGATFWGIDADAACLAHGVTSYVDAGSAGAHTFTGLARILRTSRLRARAFLNIASGGLAMPHGELLAIEAADVEAAVRVARDHPDLVVGFKLRASPNTVGDHGLAALSAMRRAADDAGLPVMVHVSEPAPELATVLDHLRDGDVLTHCFTPYDNAVVDGNGRVRPEVRAALDRGVRLDVGHGSGSFSFPKAEAYAGAGLPMPITSSDLHSRSVLGPAFHMGVVMSKMLIAGFGLNDVLRSATSSPGCVLGGSCGLHEGARADVAVLKRDDRAWTAWDSRGVERAGMGALVCRMTVVAGEVAHVSPDLRLRAG